MNEALTTLDLEQGKRPEDITWSEANDLYGELAGVDLPIDERRYPDGIDPVVMIGSRSSHYPPMSQRMPKQVALNVPLALIGRSPPSV